MVMATEEESAAAAAGKLRDAGVGCVVVIRAGRPVGILTDRDLAIRVVAESRDAGQTRLSEIVTYDPIVIDEDAEISTATLRMRQHGVRRLPLIDARGNVTGIVTADDLVVLLGRQLADVCHGIENCADTTESR